MPTAQAGQSRVLHVPYVAQPIGITRQATSSQVLAITESS